MTLVLKASDPLHDLFFTCAETIQSTHRGRPVSRNLMAIGADIICKDGGTIRQEWS
jgi:hypothetical protein